MSFGLGFSMNAGRLLPLQPSVSFSHGTSFKDFPSGFFPVNATGRIEGNIYNYVDGVNVPARRRLFLIRDHDMVRLRTKFSDPATGYYRFDYLEMGYTYSVIAYDTTQTLNATIKDKISPLPMPTT